MSIIYIWCISMMYGDAWIGYKNPNIDMKIHN